MTEVSALPLQRFVDPNVVSTHFHIREGDVVADLGAGSGYFVEVLARLVGSSGRVYACEIQKDLVEKLGTIVRSKGLSMVDPIWCDIESEGGLKITDNALDVAIMVNTLFQFEDTDAALKEVYRTLRSGGKFFIVDWTESFGGLGPQPGSVVSLKDAQALAETAGFVYERTFDAGDHHYGLALRKP